MTVAILIGNSDDKLSQRRWHEYVTAVARAVNACASEVHFHALSYGSDPWQNACWVFVLRDGATEHGFKTALRGLCEAFEQDSIAVLTGETEFVAAPEPVNAPKETRDGR